MVNKQKNKYDADKIWSTSWIYIKTVIDIAREPFLILDENLRVLAANSRFFTTFQVSEKETEGVFVYDLGNRQWDIPRLRKLLEEIVPQNTFFRDFEVDHTFDRLGRKIMLLNGRRIFKGEGEGEGEGEALIILAMEDVTDRRLVSEKLAAYAQKIEAQLGSRMEDLATQVKRTV